MSMNMAGKFWELFHLYYKLTALIWTVKLIIVLSYDESNLTPSLCLCQHCLCIGTCIHSKSTNASSKSTYIVMYLYFVREMDRYVYTYTYIYTYVMLFKEKRNNILIKIFRALALSIHVNIYYLSIVHKIKR